MQRDNKSDKPVASVGDIKKRFQQAENEKKSSEVKDNAAEIAARKARIAARNAMHGNLAATVSAPTPKALDPVLNDATRKAKFSDVRSKMVKWHEAMHEDSRSNIAKLLNIRHLLVDIQPQVMQVMPVPAPSKSSIQQAAVVQGKVASPMQMFPVTGMFAHANAQAVELVQLPAAQSALFAEIFNFDYLLKATLERVTKLPVDQVITPEEVNAKLNAFLQSVNQFDLDAFLKFKTDHIEYDNLLLKLRNHQVDESTFVQYQAKFVNSFNELLPQIEDTVAHLSDLIAYLDNNPGLGMDILAALRAEYEKQGRDENVQLKAVLIERCSPNICAILELKNNDKDSVLTKVEAVLANNALMSNNEVRINKLFK
jgi:hypothetical protein